MTLKTKYSVGDMVYTSSGSNTPNKYYVIAIDIAVKMENIFIIYSLVKTGGGGDVVRLPEPCVFQTPADVAAFEKATKEAFEKERAGERRSDIWLK